MIDLEKLRNHDLTGAQAAAEVERLRNLAADLMELADEMPIKHPQQATRRNILRGQCALFGVIEQKTDTE